MSLGCVCGVIASTALALSGTVPQIAETSTASEVASPPEPTSEPPSTPAYESPPPGGVERRLAPEPPSKPVIESKWAASFYGFVELDGAYDSTQSFDDFPGNVSVQRSETYAGSHRRFQMSVRNSRMGFKLAAPEYGGIKASAQLEMDFLGNQPSDASEASLFNNPTLRLRHFNVRLVSSAFELLAGQYWELFGWQTTSHANSVQYQGLPGEIYARTPQLRLSRMFKGDPLSVEVAVAALRPPQRDSVTPDGQAGIRLILDSWKGARTAGSTGSSVDPLSIGVSGTLRRFALKELSASPRTEQITTGWGVSVDALLPIIPATSDARGNALTFTGSAYKGRGIADTFSRLTGGVSVPALPNPMMMASAPTANVDAGLVAYDGAGELRAIEWHGFFVGLQYYLPPSGSFWISANYSMMVSDNMESFGFTATKVWKQSRFADVNLFADITPAVRFGLEGALYNQTYVDTNDFTTYRVQGAAFYLF
jgi:hypothetical protein